MRILFASLAVVAALAATAQHSLLTSYDWDPAPAIPDGLRQGTDSDVLLKRNTISQYDDSGQELAFYELFHLQRYAHDEASVEANKTMEISVGHIDRIIRIKARSVSADGTVHELGESAFKRRVDEEDNREKLYFAFEGLQPGSIVEYMMLCKQSGDIQGDITRMQFNIPVVEQRYELLVPRGWQFAFKGYNGVPQPEADTTHAGITRHHLLLTDTPALPDEKSAMPGRYQRYIISKVDAIPDRGLRDISGYVTATRNYHKALYPELSKGTQRSLASLIKKMGLSYARDEEDRIRTMSKYIRGNFRMTENGNAQLSDLDEILRTGNCSQYGLQRLYANLFREAGIAHETVVTSDREELPFDPDFEAFNYLNDMSFYFPGIGKYLDPAAFGLGLGYLPTENMGTHALFIKNVDVGGLWAGVGSIKRIPELPAESTRHDLDIGVTISEDGGEATITVVNELTGYYASFTQNYWPFLQDEQRKEVIDNHLNHLIEGASEEKVEVENAEQQYFGVKPLTFRGTVTTPLYTSRAGDDLILKVGELIGPQMEMYQEKERVLPVDEGFNRYYDRRIRITVPKGWNVEDLSPLMIHKTLEFDGKMQAEFKSTATLQDGQVLVEATEYYRSTHVPLEKFEDYRAVINAAADFNKRALLLHPVKP